MAAQFLVESTAMGLFGGMIEASLGLLVVVAVSASRTWTPVLVPWLPLAVPLLEAVSGLVRPPLPGDAGRRLGAGRGAARRVTRPRSSVDAPPTPV